MGADVTKSRGYFSIDKEGASDIGTDGDTVWTASGWWGTSIAEALGLSGECRISPVGVMQITAAMICLDVLAQDISKTTLRFKKRVKGGFVEVLPNEHPIAEMLALEPNRRHTWPEFTQMMVYHLGLMNNSYAYIRRRRDGVPEQIVPLAPRQVQEAVDQESGDVFYQINASSVQEAALLGAEMRIAHERDVVHIRNRLLDGFWGTSTIAVGAQTLRMGQEVLDYERRMYSGHVYNRGYFHRDKPADSDSTVNDQIFRRIKSQIEKILSQRAGPGDAVLLEDGIKFEKFGMTAVEANLDKALDNQIEAICKLWRMPPHKIMHFASIKYENLQTIEKQYVKDTLLPLCRLIEERIARTLLTREERLKFKFEFDRDEIAIDDEEAHREWIKMMLDKGAISLNEAREEAGWNPRPGGNVYIVPVNVQLVDSRNNVVVAPATGSNAEETETEDPPAKGFFKPRVIEGR